MGRHARPKNYGRYRVPVIGITVLLAGSLTPLLLTSGTSHASSPPQAVAFACAGQTGFTHVSLTAQPVCPWGETGVSWQVVVSGPPVPSPTPTVTSTPTPTWTPPPSPSITPTPTWTPTPTITPTPSVTPSITPSATVPAPTPTPSVTPTGGGQYFGLAPAGTSLPRSDAYCAANIQPMAEVIPGNATANHTIPSGGVPWGPWATKIPYFAQVDGNFTGTTGEILEWAACKWGWDQDYAFAEATRESGWNQATIGDSGHSFGILQIRSAPSSQPGTANTGWGGYPWTHTATALAAEGQMAYLRACYDGKTQWPAGDAWGCIGTWFSGQWHTAAADGYIGRVQAVLNAKSWP